MVFVGVCVFDSRYGSSGDHVVPSVVLEAREGLRLIEACLTCWLETLFGLVDAPFGSCVEVAAKATQATRVLSSPF